MLADVCLPCTVILSKGGQPGDGKHDVATTPGQVYITCVAVECVPVMPQHLLVLYGDNADCFDNALKMQRSCELCDNRPSSLCGVVTVGF